MGYRAFLWLRNTECCCCVSHRLVQQGEGFKGRGAMGIKVYGIATYNCQRVTLALLEFGVEDFELVKVYLKAGEHDAPSWTSMTPFKQVPVFECGDFHLYESRAIVRYIARKYKGQGPSLFGSTLEEQAIVDQWSEAEAYQFSFSFLPWSLEYYVGRREERPLNEGVLKPFYDKLATFFDICESQLSKTKYLAGDFYSVVDLNIAPSLLRVMTLKPELITTRKHVKRWYDSLASRPAFRKMLQADEHWAFALNPSPAEILQALPA